MIFSTAGGRAAAVALVLILVSAPAAATRSDVAKERRWAEQVIDGLLDGDELWLSDSGGHEFFNVLTGGEGDRHIANLARIAVPVLDLYGELDLDPVVGAAARPQSGYRQAVGAGADHFWQGEVALLLRHVRDWLGVD